MSRLDDELEEAVSDAENKRAAGAVTGSVDATSPEARPVVSDTSGEESSRRGWMLLGGLGVIVAGILGLFFTSSEDAVVYAYGVDELSARAPDLGQRQVRVMGHLVSGSLVRRDSPCEYRFRMTKSNVELPVYYAQCVVPDTFRDVKGVEVEVTAEGRMAADGHLEASKIMAKCPSKYEMKEQANATGARPEHAANAAPEYIPPREEPGIR